MTGPTENPGYKGSTKFNLADQTLEPIKLDTCKDLFDNTKEGYTHILPCVYFGQELIVFDNFVEQFSAELLYPLKKYIAPFSLVRNVPGEVSDRTLVAVHKDDNLILTKWLDAITVFHRESQFYSRPLKQNIYTIIREGDEESRLPLLSYTVDSNKRCLHFTPPNAVEIHPLFSLKNDEPIEETVKFSKIFFKEDPDNPYGYNDLITK